MKVFVRKGGSGSLNNQGLPFYDKRPLSRKGHRDNTALPKGGLIYPAGYVIFTLMSKRNRINLLLVAAAAAALVYLACGASVTEPDTADKGTTWVADASGGVYKIGAACKAVAASAVDLGKPSAVVYDSYNGYCWVADVEGGRVLRMTQRGVVDKTLYGFGEPVALAYFPKEGTVWVADRAGGKVSKLGMRGSVMAEVGGFVEPVALAVDYRNGDVFVADKGDGAVVRLDRNAKLKARFRRYDQPSALAFDHGAGYLWVADTGNGRICKTNPTTGETVKTSHALATPSAIAVNAGTNVVFAADITAGKVISLDADASKVRWARNYKRPTALAANPYDHSLWVADEYSYAVYKLHGNTGNPYDEAVVGGFEKPVALFADPGLR